MTRTTAPHRRLGGCSSILGVAALVAVFSLTAPPAGAQPLTNPIPGSSNGSSQPVQTDPAEVAPIGPGTTVLISDDDALEPGDRATTCTIAYLAVPSDSSAPYALTAGHCGEIGDTVFVEDSPVGSIQDRRSPQADPDGAIEPAQAHDPDWALIALSSDVPLSPGSGLTQPRRLGTAAVGDKVCTEGSTSGRACGTVTAVDGDWIGTDIPREPGDSGGPLHRVTDEAGLGILGHTADVPLFAGGSSWYYSLSRTLDDNQLLLAVKQTRPALVS